MYKVETTATVTVLRGADARPSHVLVLFPGYGMSGLIAARSLRPHLPSDTALVAVSYAERGVNPKAIAEDVESALRSLAARHVVFYGASMGGLVAEEVSSRYASENPDSETTLVLDTAPASVTDIRRPSPLLKAACAIPGGIISSVAWDLLARLAPRVPRSGASAALEAQGRDYGQSVGTPALTSQACYVARASPVGHATATRRTFFVQASDADEHDPLINTATARKRWQELIPDLRESVVEGRRGAWHIPLVERPTDVARVLGEVRSAVDAQAR